MRNLFKKMFSLVMAGVLAISSLAFAPAALAVRNNTMPYDLVSAEPTAGEMMADALMVRPVMALGTVATTAVFLVSLPFSLLGGNAGDAADKLVVEPFKRTFLHPLGAD